MNPLKFVIQLKISESFTAFSENNVFREEFDKAFYKHGYAGNTYIHDALKEIYENESRFMQSFLDHSNFKTRNKLEFIKIKDFELSEMEAGVIFQTFDSNYSGVINYSIESAVHILVNTHAPNTIVFYSQKDRDLRFFELDDNYKCIILPI